MSVRLIVTDAFTQHGWSAGDHRIDDGPIQGMIGNVYSSLSDLARDADRLADRLGYATVEYRREVYLMTRRAWQDDGRHRYDGSAGLGIPGRSVPRTARVQ